jgi:predicted RNase H-like nuclease
MNIGLPECIKAEKTAQVNARKLVRKRKPRCNVIPAKAAVRRIGIQNKTSA